MEVRDYNGTGRWTSEAIIERYQQHCSDLGVRPAPLQPRELVQGDVRWVCPLMETVIARIKEGDRGCIDLGIELIEEDARMPFGRTMKPKAARALRHVELTRAQQKRILRRVITMLADAKVPREFSEYARLAVKIGVREVWPQIDKLTPRNRPYAMKWLEYFRQHVDREI